MPKAARVTVVFGEPVQDLGIWAYRSVGEDGINFGSAVNFAKGVLGDSAETSTTALVIANTGQVLWHCASSRAVTQRTWEAADRPVGPWGPATKSWRNEIPGNRDWREHIQYTFEHVISPWLDPKKCVDIIGLSEGGEYALEYLQRNCKYSVLHGIYMDKNKRSHSLTLLLSRGYLEAIHLWDLPGNPLQSTAVDLDMSILTDPQSFTAFLASRGRAYVLSSSSLGQFQNGFRQHGCNCYASGEELNTECIMPRAWPDMLTWLDMLYERPEYAEQVIIKPEDVDEQTLEALEKTTSRDEGSQMTDSMAKSPAPSEVKGS